MKLARVPVYDRRSGLVDIWSHVRDDVVDKASFLSARAVTKSPVLIEDETVARPDWMVDLLFGKGGTCHVVATTASAFRELFDFEPPVCLIND